MASPEQERAWAEKVRQREEAWNAKVQGKERAWTDSHPGIASVNAVMKGDFSRTPWLSAEGDPAENAAFADVWGRMGKNRELTAVKAAEMDNPNDPYAQGFARTKARIASGSDMANAFAQQRLDQARRRQQALMQILGLSFGGDQNAIAQNAARDAGNDANNAALWGFGGDLLGKALSFRGGGAKRT